MARDYTAYPPHQVRRKDRAVEDESWIKAFLHRAPMGVLATVHEGQPFAHSNLFVYDEAEHAIFFHTASEGRTRSNVEAAPRACFSISEMGRLLPADVALEFSVEYNGVAVFGTIRIVDDPETCTIVLHKLLDKYFPHLQRERDYRPVVAEELKRTTVFRLDIGSWSGKRKAVDDDFPGAFLYGNPPDKD